MRRVLQRIVLGQCHKLLNNGLPFYDNGRAFDISALNADFRKGETDSHFLPVARAAGWRGRL